VRCGGRLKVIASIEEPELIERILAHKNLGVFQQGLLHLPTTMGTREPQ
jgi:hypothetical protein